MVVANGAITYRRAKTLASQLEQIGVKPDDVTYVTVSHTHGDHVRNIALFPTSTVLIQGAEYDWAMAGPAKPTFVATQKIEKLTGDRDVFGDGTVKIVSTPGHTPGHQSLLVQLPKTGWLLLSGDAVHFQDNWTHKRVPSMNFNRDQTLASLQRIAALLEERKAQLWINHDKPQSATLRYAPALRVAATAGNHARQGARREWACSRGRMRARRSSSLRGTGRPMGPETGSALVRLSLAAASTDGVGRAQQQLEVLARESADQALVSGDDRVSERALALL
jgi:glyoxylase-like metal-dependent hydrolase (beta-lactamase superfamily II)